MTPKATMHNGKTVLSWALCLDLLLDVTWLFLSKFYEIFNCTNFWSTRKVTRIEEAFSKWAHFLCTQQFYENRSNRCLINMGVTLDQEKIRCRTDKFRSTSKIEFHFWSKASIVGHAHNTNHSHFKWTAKFVFFSF